MAKLSKATRRSLERILADMDRAALYLDSGKVSVAMRTRRDTAGAFVRKELTPEYREHVLRGYTGPDYALYEVDHHVGSDLAGFWAAREDLRNFLKPDEKIPADWR